MANRNNPHGFKARFHTTGGEIRPVQVKLVAANAEIFPGDVLEQADTGEYDIAEAADVIGAISAEYSAASSGASILAYIDPYIAFSAQCDDGTGTASAQTCVGLNADFVATAGSGGHSNMEIDESSANTTATLPWKIIGLYQEVGNAFGEFNQLVVVPNNHKMKGGTGTLGV